MPVAAVLRRLAETLERPGTPRDYHDAIQDSAFSLMRRRREQPEVHEEVERLLWLDIRLSEARPDAIASSAGEPFYPPAAFETLIQMYEREGALRDALDVAERATRWGLQQAKVEELRERLRQLEAENAG